MTADARTGSGLDADRRTIAEEIVRAGALAVLRFRRGDPAREVVSALTAGGVVGVEVTMTSPGAIDLIASLRRDPPGSGVLLGVGSVRDAATVRAAVDAGACYVVSPAIIPEVIDAARGAGVAALPGAYTPSEMAHAVERGADLVKVFPADTLGPGFIRAVRAAMPDLRLVPTGGVTPENAGEWLSAGAVAVGLGSALVPRGAVEARDFDELTRRARTLTRAIAAARDSV